MSSKDPAFPVVTTGMLGGQKDLFLGLTKREHFAGQALHGLLANPNMMKKAGDGTDLSTLAVSAADATLKALGET